MKEDIQTRKKQRRWRRLCEDNDFVSEIAAEICDHYCKYPEIYDEEAEGIPLCDSEHCRNCPLGG